jgi:hypothetical protein
MDEVFWLVQEKLTHFVDSCLGYIYSMSTPNTYTSDMKLVDSSESKVTGYMTSSAFRRAACTKNMASGLSEAHNLIGYRGHWNGIILLFSDGLINKGDFFDGAEDFISQVPVHTFTLGGDAYNHVPNNNLIGAKFDQLSNKIMNIYFLFICYRFSAQSQKIPGGGYFVMSLFRTSRMYRCIFQDCWIAC